MSTAGMNNVKTINLTPIQQSQVQNLVNESSVANGRTVTANIKALTPEQRAVVILAFEGTIPKGFKLEGDIQGIIDSMKTNLKEGKNTEEKSLVKSAEKKTKDFLRDRFGMSTGRIQVGDVENAIKSYTPKVPVNGVPKPLRELTESEHEILNSIVEHARTQPDELEDKLKSEIAKMSPGDKEVFAKRAMIDLSKNDPDLGAKLLKVFHDSTPKEKQISFMQDIVHEVFTHNIEGAMNLAKALAGPQIAREVSSAQPLRLSDVTTRFLTAFVSKLISPQLEKPLLEIAKKVSQETDDLSKMMTSGDSEKASVALENITSHTSEVLNMVSSLINNGSDENIKHLKDLCSFIKNEVQKGKDNLKKESLDPEGVALSLIFLRVVSPQISAFTNPEFTTPQFRQNMVALGKIVQSLTVGDVGAGKGNLFNDVKGKLSEEMKEIKKSLLTEEKTTEAPHSPTQQETIKLPTEEKYLNYRVKPNTESRLNFLGKLQSFISNGSEGALKKSDELAGKEMEIILDLTETANLQKCNPDQLLKILEFLDNRAVRNAANKELSEELDQALSNVEAQIGQPQIKVRSDPKATAEAWTALKAEKPEIKEAFAQLTAKYEERKAKNPPRTENAERAAQLKAKLDERIANKKSQQK